MLRKIAGLGLLLATVASGCGDDGGSDKASADAEILGDSGAQDAGAEGGSQVMQMRQDAGPPPPGQCSPKAGPSLSELLASKTGIKLLDQRKASDPFVHDGDLYYVESGVGLRRIPKGSTQPETLLPRTTMDQPSWARVADDKLYFQDSAMSPVSRVPLSNPSATPEAMVGMPHGYPRLIQGDTLYGYGDAASGSTQELWKQDFKTGAVQVLATVQEEFGGIDVADGFVYYTDTTFGVEELFRVSTNGGKPERLSNGSYFRLQAVKVVGGNVYWADGYRLHVTQIGATDLRTGTQPFGNYSPAMGIAASTNGTRDGYALTEIGDRIYWIDDNGTVGWTSKDRETCGALVTIPFPDDVIGFGGGFIYASGFTSGVVRIPMN